MSCDGNKFKKTHINKEEIWPSKFDDWKGTESYVETDQFGIL